MESASNIEETATEEDHSVEKNAVEKSGEEDNREDMGKVSKQWKLNPVKRRPKPRIVRRHSKVLEEEEEVSWHVFTSKACKADPSHTNFPQHTCMFAA